MTQTAEHQRLAAHRSLDANWKNWGPYLSERAWGTVREDYSVAGSPWTYFPHDHARSRTYRWNEDGLAGISDRNQYICFSLALWNGRDPILKERLFGLTGPEGNHGEDVKEVYFYLDSTPTHSYMKMLYKYPHAAFPYDDLVGENARRGYDDPEYELLDTGVFDDDRYFDVVTEYAKADENDLLIRVTVTNRGDRTAACHLLPQLWFRNTWSWGYPDGPMADAPGKPLLRAVDGSEGVAVIEIEHPAAGRYFFYAEDGARLLFTENETNHARLHSGTNASPFVKDAFHRYLVEGDSAAVNPARAGTKAAAHSRHELAPGASVTLRLRLQLTAEAMTAPLGEAFDATFQARRDEADEFYASLQNPGLSEDERNVQRQALAGMLWTKQLYYYDVSQWLDGDPAQPPPARRDDRNRRWIHLHNFDVISMPDKWEYPWYATWDLAFHCLPLAQVDPDFAKRQLLLFTREWYMNPSGALPAYEWSFDHVNPPVHAWATWRVYEMDRQQTGRPDRAFLEEVFHKMVINFTWWVNRKDFDENNIFQGGFLGLDNISIFDRSAKLPPGRRIDQSDGTSWMGFYSLIMMRMALELARENPVYQRMAAKFFEHFLRIAAAMNYRGGHEAALWDAQDGFFYDALHLDDDNYIPLRVRSLVGLMPLIAVETIDDDLLAEMPIFARQAQWFMAHRPELARDFIGLEHEGGLARSALALLTKERLVALLRYMLDENEFLSEYGIRSLSKYHAAHPYRVTIDGVGFEVSYWPGESHSGLFGGNSNWRGPVWFPINFLFIEALQRFHSYYGDTLRVECPTGSGRMATLDEVAADLSHRLSKLFLRHADGRRPAHGESRPFQDDPHWRDYLLFYEYFHGDSGAGLGASHQTGWTGLVATLLQAREQ